MGSSIKRKNFLLQKQILSINGLPVFEKEGKIKNGRVASPESVHNHSNLFCNELFCL